MNIDALDGVELCYERPWWDNGEVIVSIRTSHAEIEARFPHERTAGLRRFCAELVKEIDEYEKRMSDTY